MTLNDRCFYMYKCFYMRGLFLNDLVAMERGYEAILVIINKNIAI